MESLRTKLTSKLHRTLVELDKIDARVATICKNDENLRQIDIGIAELMWETKEKLDDKILELNEEVEHLINQISRL